MLKLKIDKQVQEIASLALFLLAAGVSCGIVEMYNIMRLGLNVEMRLFFIFDALLIFLAVGLLLRQEWARKGLIVWSVMLLGKWIYEVYLQNIFQSYSPPIDKARTAIILVMEICLPCLIILFLMHPKIKEKFKRNS